VVDAAGRLVGIVTRRDIDKTGIDSNTPLARIIARPPVVVYDDSSLREAADHMVRHNVGRLPVISREDPGKLVGMITRSDVLDSHRRRIQASQSPTAPTVMLPFLHGHRG
jgi:CBS domain-containing protein